MSRGTPDERKPVTPDERLHIASVRPTTSAPLGWSGVRAEHLTNPPDAEVDLPPTTRHWLVLNHGRALAFSLRFAGQEQTELGPPDSLTLIPAGYPSQWRWRGASGNSARRYGLTRSAPKVMPPVWATA
jgi:hypothetical protein